MAFQVVIPKKVQKELDKIPDDYRYKLIATFSIISNNPYCGKKLEGKRKEEWSCRVWPYRVIYRIFKHDLVILIITVGHRQSVY